MVSRWQDFVLREETVTSLNTCLREFIWKGADKHCIAMGSGQINLVFLGEMKGLEKVSLSNCCAGWRCILPSAFFGKLKHLELLDIHTLMGAIPCFKGNMLEKLVVKGLQAPQTYLSDVLVSSASSLKYLKLHNCLFVMDLDAIVLCPKLKKFSLLHDETIFTNVEFTNREL